MKAGGSTTTYKVPARRCAGPAIRVGWIAAGTTLGLKRIESDYAALALPRKRFVDVFLEFEWLSAHINDIDAIGLLGDLGKRINACAGGKRRSAGSKTAWAVSEIGN